MSLMPNNQAILEVIAANFEFDVKFVVKRAQFFSFTKELFIEHFNFIIGKKDLKNLILPLISQIAPISGAYRSGGYWTIRGMKVKA